MKNGDGLYAKMHDNLHAVTRSLITIYCCKKCRMLVGCRVDHDVQYCKTCHRGMSCPDERDGDLRIEGDITFSCCLM